MSYFIDTTKRHNIFITVEMTVHRKSKQEHIIKLL